MSIFDDIQKEVEKRAVGELLPRLFEIEKDRHAKRGFREGCDCTYCQAKRVATSEIAHLGSTVVARKVGELARDSAYGSVDSWELSRYARQIIRDAIRAKNRAILREKFDER